MRPSRRLHNSRDKIAQRDERCIVLRIHLLHLLRNHSRNNNNSNNGNSDNHHHYRRHHRRRHRRDHLKPALLPLQRWEYREEMPRMILVLLYRTLYTLCESLN